MQTCSVSIIIPTLNEATSVVATLLPLQSMRKIGYEIIVVDGGSSDATQDLARPYVDELIITAPGRAKQMNAGATQAKGDIVLFLHADTQLPIAFSSELHIQLSAVNKVWGHFSVCFSSTSAWMRIVAAMMNYRSRLTGIATGDQVIFVRRDCLNLIGGYADIPLMEDIDLSKRLKKFSWPLCLSDKVTTSARRWQQKGIAKTILLMWRLRLAYFFGADPAMLARIYYPSRHDYT